MKRIFILLSFIVVFNLNSGTSMSKIAESATNRLSAAVQIVTQGSMQNQLIKAIRSDDLNEVQKLIEQGAHVNTTDQKDPSPLHIAVEERNIAIIQALIDAGADVNARDADGITPLIYGSASSLRLTPGWGETAIVQMLIDAGADVNALSADTDNYNSLHTAVSHANINVVQVLLNAGADVNARNEANKTPLYFLASGGLYSHECQKYKDAFIGIVKLLTNAGANIDACDDDNQTPLYKVAAVINTFRSQTLIDSGANVNISDKQGNTPLCGVLLNPLREISLIKSLIDAGADLNVQNKRGYTPISLARGETQQLLQNIVNIEQQLGNLTPEDSIESILDQYDQDVQSTIIKRLISQGEFNLVAQALRAYPELQQSIRQLILRNPYSLENFSRFIVDNNLLNLLNEDNAAIIEFINKWSQEVLNSITARTILLGQIPENANEIEYRAYNIARANAYKELGKLIRDWAEKAQILDGDMILPSDIASKISSY